MNRIKIAAFMVVTLLSLQVYSQDSSKYKLSYQIHYSMLVPKLGSEYYSARFENEFGFQVLTSPYKYLTVGGEISLQFYSDYVYGSNSPQPVLPLMIYVGTQFPIGSFEPFLGINIGYVQDISKDQVVAENKSILKLKSGFKYKFDNSIGIDFNAGYQRNYFKQSMPYYSNFGQNYSYYGIYIKNNAIYDYLFLSLGIIF